jgi:hypothetical protein
MTAKANTASDTSDRELVFTRLLDAPRALALVVWLVGVLLLLPAALGQIPLGRTAALALRLWLGVLAGLLLPIWLPFAVLVWLIRYVLWSLLVPEFRRSLLRRGQRGDERLVTFVGLRYLFTTRETALQSATSYYAAAGIALGVCALIVVLAVMSGFDQEVKSRIVGTNAHVILLRVGNTGILHADSLAARVATHPDVEAVAPFVYSKAMLSAGLVFSLYPCPVRACLGRRDQPS